MKKTLNLGCGERTYIEYPDGYECNNYDERNLKKVDTIGDVKVLPFDNNTFDYILASDIIEHFPIKDIKNILTEWKRVLMLGGIIEFRLPNLKEICRKYVVGEIDAKLTSWLLFGGQDYSGNYHYVCFDREWFRDTVESIGFKEIEYKDVDNNFEIKFQK